MDHGSTNNVLSITFFCHCVEIDVEFICLNVLFFAYMDLIPEKLAVWNMIFAKNMGFLPLENFTPETFAQIQYILKIPFFLQ